MRVLAAILAIACLGLTGCQSPAGALKSRTSADQSPRASSCPDGKTVQPGLTAFGAYIGTWQANHERVPQSSDYAFTMTSGWVSVRCSAADYVVVEAINLKFSVPNGRALQFALSDLPADSKKVFDHVHSSCRTLQYQSSMLARQLPSDDAAGLANVTVRNPTDSSGAQLQVLIEVGTALGDESGACR